MPSARCPASTSMLPRLRCAWTERSSMASAARNSAIAPAASPRLASAMPRLLCASTEFGLDCERAAEALHRIAGLALFEQRVGEVVAGAGEVGLELERLLVARDRFVEPAGGAQRRAEVVVAGRVVGPQRDRRARGARSPRRSGPCSSSAVPRLFSVIAIMSVDDNTGQFAKMATRDERRRQLPSSRSPERTCSRGTRAHVNRRARPQTAIRNGTSG